MIATLQSWGQGIVSAENDTVFCVAPDEGCAITRTVENEIEEIGPSPPTILDVSVTRTLPPSSVDVPPSSVYEPVGTHAAPPLKTRLIFAVHVFAPILVQPSDFVLLTFGAE